MENITRMVVNPSPIVLPRRISGRIPPRPANQRQEGYEDLFDDRTLFYDAVCTDSGVELIGPPLLNLEALVNDSLFLSDRRPADVSIHSLNRTSITKLHYDTAPQGVVNMISSSLIVSLNLSRNLQDLFRDCNVLVTKSKNNRLEWISDWVKFHVTEQNVNAVLIYDNGSTAYGPEDVLDAISMHGVKTAVVVRWPFKFGPQGGNWNGLKNAPWDSDYCEYGIMEHARRRFLESARGVLNADVDELVMTKGDGTVFDAALASRTGAVYYTGRWIETAGQTGTSESFADYTYYDTRRPPTTPKWTIAPQKMSRAIQWKTHAVVGIKMEECKATMHRHFMGISSDWKWQRTKQKPVTSHHQVDIDLRRSMERAFYTE
ncbi:hypothetical protein [Arthrobacter sp. 08Y14]|uniref:hypothetical protein n=1 Tax=Arthrobacter sp. 08Y14 TaxID=2058885 RepID=UPI0011B0165C|nr:hypothetical protein [Arthrobacter sp. 08Y14]